MLDLVVPDAGPLMTLALRAQVLAAGRNLARDLFERRARASDGVAADWQGDYDTGNEAPRR